MIQVRWIDGQMEDYDADGWRIREVAPDVLMLLKHAGTSVEKEVACLPIRHIRDWQVSER